MTGDFTLRLPVMLAVAIATTTRRALSYGTIYHTKLLRRGRDIDRAPARPSQACTGSCSAWLARWRLWRLRPGYSISVGRSRS
jgi:hypothetical protein